MAGDVRPFGELFAESPRNGLNRPKAVRGFGVKMVNMGELFAHPRLRETAMDRVPLSDNEAERFLLADGDLLFARQSLVLEGAGKCSIFLHDSEPVTFESHVTRVRLDVSKADPQFYFYYLQSHHGRAAIRSIVEQGAGASGIRGSDLQALDVLWRPTEEQRAIAHILGTLDDKIELNRRMNETLEAIAQALFKSWFVDFDPVRAKVGGRDPGLSKPFADLFPDSIEDSELGEIPKTWKVGRLDQIASVVMGLSPDGASYNSRALGVPLINGPVEFGDYFPLKTKWTTSPTRVGQAGDLILCVRGSTTGRRVVADDVYCLGRGVCAMRAKEHARTFLYLTVDVALGRLLSKATGSVFPSLSAPDIKALAVLIPAEAVLRSFEALMMPLTERREANVKVSHTLAALRDTLLPKLISGEVRVKHADRFIERAIG